VVGWAFPLSLSLSLGLGIAGSGLTVKSEAVLSVLALVTELNREDSSLVIVGLPSWCQEGNRAMPSCSAYYRARMGSIWTGVGSKPGAMERAQVQLVGFGVVSSVYGRARVWCEGVVRGRAYAQRSEDITRYL
jgi:hypothetical protein